MSRVASTVAALDGRSTVRIDVDVDDVPMDTTRAGQLGLLVSGLVSNALHAFVGRDRGVMEVRLLATSSGARLTVADDGIGMGDNWRAGGDGMGSRIVDGLAAGLGGALGASTSEAGTVLTLDVATDGVPADRKG